MNGTPFIFFTFGIGFGKSFVTVNRNINISRASPKTYKERLQKLPKTVIVSMRYKSYLF